MPGQAIAPEGRGDFAALARRVLPSVVGVSVRRTIPGMPQDAVHGGFGVASTGSGFVIDPGGLVVTNNHVIEGGSSFEISLSDGTILPATLVGRDPDTDLALLRVRSARALPALAWGNSDGVEVGQWAIAIGSPFGLGNSLSVGVISGRNRDLQASRFDDFLQTDAAINRGNSGGPLFNAQGQVIGVNTAIVSPGGAQGGSVGVGFAVPSNLARQVVRDLAASGVVRRGWIGLRARPRSAGEPEGIVVVEVAPASPAARAGLRPGDRLTRWQGEPLPDPRALARLAAAAAQGSRVRVDGQRGRQAIFANITVGRSPTEVRPATGAPQAASTAPSTSALGLSLRPASPADRGPASPGGAGGQAMPEGVQVIIGAVDPFGPGRRIVEPGDGLMEVQGRPVRSPAEARALLEETARARDAIVIKLWRDGAVIVRALRSPR